jgi:pimeloyl-ACP methyl ester carboxylesterase
MPLRTRFPSPLPGTEQAAAVVDGARIRYLIGGDGPALILVHGIAASSFSFRHNTADLTRHFRVVVPDLMNVGYSDRVPGLPASLSHTAARLDQFLDKLRIGSADILGSSHGGSVVMAMAAQAPQRFRRMVLVSPANPFAAKYDRLVKFYLGAVGGVFLRSAPFLPGKIWDYGIGRMYADPRKMTVGTGIGYARPLRIRGTMRHILECLRTFNEDLEQLRSKLCGIAAIPTAVIWGDRDPVVEIDSGRQLQKALNADMFVMPGVGHLPYEESPEEFNRILMDYLKR